MSNKANYIGVKQIQAEPMNLFDYRALKGAPTGEAHKSQEGYLVHYSPEYSSWSPKEVFEKAYLQIKDPTRITEDDVKSFIKEVNVYTKEVFGKPSTHVEVLLLNGYIITEQSTSVDPVNYSMEIGEEICMERIYTKIWDLLGFTLATARFGIK
ncbi:MAG: Gp49 family protein [Cetobacterium sp.]|uniref:Gp49 family protein n=1 Tax=Cetobacterium sp. TaxID=2071632 RepID=UPI003F36B7AD